MGDLKIIPLLFLLFNNVLCTPYGYGGIKTGAVAQSAAVAGAGAAIVYPENSDYGSERHGGGGYGDYTKSGASSYASASAGAFSYSGAGVPTSGIVFPVKHYAGAGSYSGGYNRGYGSSGCSTGLCGGQIPYSSGCSSGNCGNKLMEGRPIVSYYPEEEQPSAFGCRGGNCDAQPPKSNGCSGYSCGNEPSYSYGSNPDSNNQPTENDQLQVNQPIDVYSASVKCEQGNCEVTECSGSTCGVKPLANYRPQKVTTIQPDDDEPNPYENPDYTEGPGCKQGACNKKTKCLGGNCGYNQSFNQEPEPITSDNPVRKNTENLDCKKGNCNKEAPKSNQCSGINCRGDISNVDNQPSTENPTFNKHPSHVPQLSTHDIDKPTYETNQGYDAPSGGYQTGNDYPEKQRSNVIGCSGSTCKNIPSQNNEPQSIYKPSTDSNSPSSLCVGPICKNQYPKPETGCKNGKCQEVPVSSGCFGEGCSSKPINENKCTSGNCLQFNVDFNSPADIAQQNENYPDDSDCNGGDCYQQKPTYNNSPVQDYPKTDCSRGNCGSTSYPRNPIAPINRQPEAGRKKPVSSYTAIIHFPPVYQPSGNSYAKPTTSSEPNLVYDSKPNYPTNQCTGAECDVTYFPGAISGSAASGNNFQIKEVIPQACSGYSCNKPLINTFAQPQCQGSNCKRSSPQNSPCNGLNCYPQPSIAEDTPQDVPQGSVSFPAPSKPNAPKANVVYDNKPNYQPKPTTAPSLDLLPPEEILKPSSPNGYKKPTPLEPNVQNPNVDYDNKPNYQPKPATFPSLDLHPTEEILKQPYQNGNKKPSPLEPNVNKPNFVNDNKPKNQPKPATVPSLDLHQTEELLQQPSPIGNKKPTSLEPNVKKPNVVNDNKPKNQPKPTTVPSLNLLSPEELLQQPFPNSHIKPTPSEPSFNKPNVVYDNKPNYQPKPAPVPSLDLFTTEEILKQPSPNDYKKLTPSEPNVKSPNVDYDNQPNYQPKPTTVPSRDLHPTEELMKQPSPNGYKRPTPLEPNGKSPNVDYDNKPNYQPKPAPFASLDLHPTEGNSKQPSQNGFKKPTPSEPNVNKPNVVYDNKPNYQPKPPSVPSLNLHPTEEILKQPPPNDYKKLTPTEPNVKNPNVDYDDKPNYQPKPPTVPSLDLHPTEQILKQPSPNDYKKPTPSETNVKSPNIDYDDKPNYQPKPTTVPSRDLHPTEEILKQPPNGYKKPTPSEPNVKSQNVDYDNKPNYQPKPTTVPILDLHPTDEILQQPYPNGNKKPTPSEPSNNKPNVVHDNKPKNQPKPATGPSVDLHPTEEILKQPSSSGYKKPTTSEPNNKKPNVVYNNEPKNQPKPATVPSLDLHPTEEILKQPPNGYKKPTPSEPNVKSQNVDYDNKPNYQPKPATVPSLDLHPTDEILKQTYPNGNKKSTPSEPSNNKPNVVHDNKPKNQPKPATGPSVDLHPTEENLQQYSPNGYDKPAQLQPNVGYENKPNYTNTQCSGAECDVTSFSGAVTGSISSGENVQIKNVSPQACSGYSCYNKPLVNQPTWVVQPGCKSSNCKISPQQNSPCNGPNCYTQSFIPEDSPSHSYDVPQESVNFQPKPAFVPNLELHPIEENLEQYSPNSNDKPTPSELIKNVSPQECSGDSCNTPLRKSFVQPLCKSSNCSPQNSPCNGPNCHPQPAIAEDTPSNSYDVPQGSVINSEKPKSNQDVCSGTACEKPSTQVEYEPRCSGQNCNQPTKNSKVCYGTSCEAPQKQADVETNSCNGAQCNSYPQAYNPNKECSGSKCVKIPNNPFLTGSSSLSGAEASVSYKPVMTPLPQKDTVKKPYTGSFGGPPGILQPNDFSPPSQYPQSNQDIHLVKPIPSHDEQHAVPPAPQEEISNSPTGSYGHNQVNAGSGAFAASGVYTGSFGGAPGILKPNDFSLPNHYPQSNPQIQPVKPISSYQPETPVSKPQEGHNEPNAPQTEISNKPTGSYSHNQVNAGSGAFAASGVYTGSFGGAPGILKPNDFSLPNQYPQSSPHAPQTEISNTPTGSYGHNQVNAGSGAFAASGVYAGSFGGAPGILSPYDDVKGKKPNFIHHQMSLFPTLSPKKPYSEGYGGAPGIISETGHGYNSGASAGAAVSASAGSYSVGGGYSGYASAPKGSDKNGCAGECHDFGDFAKDSMPFDAGYSKSAGFDMQDEMLDGLHTVALAKSVASSSASAGSAGASAGAYAHSSASASASSGSYGSYGK